MKGKLVIRGDVHRFFGPPHSATATAAEDLLS
jgi:hypothetical protein